MKGILFDFNGTLFRDSAFHREAWKRFMKERMGKDYPDSFIRKFIGPCNHDIFRMCFGESITETDIAALSREKESYYRAVVRENPDNLRLVDGVEETLNTLSEKKIPFALATASIYENVRFYLDDLGMGRWLDLDRVVYDEGKLACKPAPDFYREAARRIGLGVQDCIVVEDSLTGIESARRARAGRIIAIDGTTPRNVLESEPDLHAVIHDFYGFVDRIA